MTTTKLQIALITFFTNIGPKLASTINTNFANFTDYLPERTVNSLFFTPTDENEILNIVRSFKSSTSCGYDGLSMHLLKEIIHYLVTPLKHIFNLSLTSGIFPNSLKVAKVIPIYKKDDPAQVKNYRPISLLPVFSKILEKIAHERLYKFLTDNEILNPNQFGFRKGFSTDFAIIQTYDKIIESLSNKTHIIGVFMDLSKAFDTINHKILLEKLHNYGVRGVVLS